MDGVPKLLKCKHVNDVFAVLLYAVILY